MQEIGLDAIPYQHSTLDKWRTNFTGVLYLHEITNLLVFGAIDDVWVQPSGELIVVDYKATSKNGKISIDAAWQIAYKRQMELYQWLLRQNGFDVSDTGYFVYCNGLRNRDSFNKILEFDISMIPYTGNDDWVEDIIHKAHSCLNSDDIPEADNDCEQCQYNFGYPLMLLNNSAGPPSKDLATAAIS